MKFPGPMMGGFAVDARWKSKGSRVTDITDILQALQLDVMEVKADSEQIS
jgi:hypothetical protein